MSLFDEVGGIEIFRKINKVFYDKIYAHPWMRQYFIGVSQEHIENQQTDFMATAFGAGERYTGRFVKDAHTHVMITEELFNLREQLLDEAFKEVGAPPALVERWKKIDNAFKNQILKKDISECKGRFASEPILDFPNPAHRFKRTG